MEHCQGFYGGSGTRAGKVCKFLPVCERGRNRKGHTVQCGGAFYRFPGVIPFHSFAVCDLSGGWAGLVLQLTLGRSGRDVVIYAERNAASRFSHLSPSRFKGPLSHFCPGWLIPSCELLGPPCGSTSKAIT